ncbi:MAG TPA: hypothetical protein PLO61_08370 [Fimbriimonadaceae bacterium]|nr:hypothetical protein [Fimbriimonadaceae bacterium]HRJ33583.1 hypothetical protein [Fimbriimonadaceae bacterium]
MSSMGRSKKLPNFRQYLADQVQRVPRNEETYFAIGGCIVTPLAVGLSFFLLKTLITPLVAALVSGLIVMPVMFAISAIISKRLSQPRNPAEADHVARHQVAKQWTHLADKSKLHRELDPVAGQLLEAGAFYWKRTQDTLKTPAWQREDLPAHWKSMRDQAMEASQSAMDDLFMLLKDCTGKPDKSRKDDLTSAFEKFGALEILDAAQELLMVATGDASQYAYRSPVLPVVFEPAKMLAEKLRDLSNEIESMTREVQAKVASGPANFSSVGTIDLLLDEMKSIQQAERELGDDQSQTHLKA